MLLALRNRAFSDVVLTFPLVNDKGEWTSTWPVKPSFPLFLRNVLYQLGNVKDAAGVQNAVIDLISVEKIASQMFRRGFDFSAIGGDGVGTHNAVGIPVAQGAGAAIAAAHPALPRLRQKVGNALTMENRVDVGIDNRVWFGHGIPACR